MERDHAAAKLLAESELQASARRIRSQSPASVRPILLVESFEEQRPNKCARKAFTCEPSKLECDRNQPCSTCAQRDDATACHDGTALNSGVIQLRGDKSLIDPAYEIASLRKSIDALEKYTSSHKHAQTTRATGTADIMSRHSEQQPLRDAFLYEQQSHSSFMMNGGFYVGPTSIAAHLSEGTNINSDLRRPDIDQMPSHEFHHYDGDLLSLLPPLATIDHFIKHYFENCNWTSRTIDPTTFMQLWTLFKNGKSFDRITLATVCVIIAVTIQYLPSQHLLLESIPGTRLELRQKYYNLMRMAIQRYEAGPGGYSLPLAELLLLRCQYLAQCKTDSEEIWDVKSQLVSMCTAMGLHCDPSKWKMTHAISERRRWIWWNIVMVDRWQAFLFGRPLSIASHHFDTHLPSSCDPALDKSGRNFAPNIAMFKLVFILGQIMDDAVSLRPVAYESILRHDRALAQWLESLPKELNLNEYDTARSLSSTDIGERRLAVQSIIMRLSFYRIRFTLHRPYANTSAGKGSSSVTRSLETAVAAADKVVSMVAQTHSGYLSNIGLASPGYRGPGPFHAFPAAMFFVFQLIRDPVQSGATLFRSNILKTVTILEQTLDTPIAGKALKILKALAPLYSTEFPSLDLARKQTQKAHTMAMVKTLAFPYHDSNVPLPKTGSPSPRQNPNHTLRREPPATSSTPISFNHESISQRYIFEGFMNSNSGTAHGVNQPMPAMTSSSQVQHSIPINEPPLSQLAPYETLEESQILPGVDGGDDELMWGAPLGFGLSEWTSFLDMMESPGL